MCVCVCVCMCRQDPTILHQYGNAHTFTNHGHEFEEFARVKLCSSTCPCTNYTAPEPVSPWPPTPSLNCSGCGCTPSEGTTSGSISDGSGLSLYGNNLECEWLLSGAAITLVFGVFDTQHYWDPVIINRCSDAACRFSGVGRQTDRQTDRQTGRQIDRLAD